MMPFILLRVGLEKTYTAHQDIVLPGESGHCIPAHIEGVVMYITQMHKSMQVCMPVACPCLCVCPLLCSYVSSHLSNLTRVYRLRVQGCHRTPRYSTLSCIA